MDTNFGIDILVLNRNRKEITDNLCRSLSNLSSVKRVAVIDSGSRPEERSDWTVVGDYSPEVISKGLRPNRGFNLGLRWWNQQDTRSDWVLLCPNDTVFTNWEFDFMKQWMSSEKLAAIVPLSESSPYTKMLGRRRFGLVWHINEGPIFLSRRFVEMIVQVCGNLFDNNNFRGYMSFLELSFRAYANNKAIMATSSVAFREDTSIIKEQFAIIETEEQQKNFQMMITEGETWLAEKYGVRDRWSFELCVRLLFEEFIRVNPEFGGIDLK